MAIDPNVDFPGFLKEAVAEEVAKAAHQGGTVTGEEPLEMNIAGQIYRYPNKAAMEAALNTFVGAVGTRMNELEQKATVGQAPPPEGSFVTGNEKQDTFDETQFVEKMTKSPKEGLDYWLNQRIFDGKSEDPVSDLKRTLTETELTKRTIAAYQFKENHPEFPGGQQAAQVIEQFRQSMNLPYDYNGIEAAYFIAMNRGALPDYKGQYMQQQQAAQFRAQQQAAAQQDQGYGYEQGNAFAPQGNANPFLGAPPGVNRNSPNFAGGVDLESLSIEQLESLAQKANMFRR